MKKAGRTEKRQKALTPRDRSGSQDPTQNADCPNDTASAASSASLEYDDPLGLEVLHTPKAKGHNVDITFIHGLDTTSLETWCYEGKRESLWPKHWLPEQVPTARILMFGNYAAILSR